MVETTGELAPTESEQVGTYEDRSDPRRWKALTVLAIVQFMVVVDATIVNVALPSIQGSFGTSAATLTWIVAGYALTASALVLLGGRTADLFGRRRVFVISLTAFGLASLICGLAPNAEVLIAGRFLQGAAEAFLGPAAMSLMVLLFSLEKERAKAFAIWGGLAGVGAVAGVLLSGMLTSMFSWRWIFLINVALMAIPLLLVRRLVDESRASDLPRRIDVPSALLLTGGLALFVRGILSASSQAWSSLAVVLPILLGLAVLAVFVLVQARERIPLIPLGFFRDRHRAVASVSAIFLSSASAAVFFLIVLYMQNVQGFTPWQSGLAWLPFCFAFIPGLMLSARLIGLIGDRMSVAVGLGVSAVGVLMMTRITAGGSFLGELVPAMVVTAAGFGLTNPALQSAALRNVTEKDAGMASGVFSTVMQLGGSLGLAAFVTLSARTQDRQIEAGQLVGTAATAGYREALLVAAAVLAFGALLTAFLARNAKRNAATSSQSAPVS